MVDFIAFCIPHIMEPLGTSSVNNMPVPKRERSPLNWSLWAVMGNQQS